VSARAYARDIARHAATELSGIDASLSDRRRAASDDDLSTKGSPEGAWIGPIRRSSRAAMHKGHARLHVVSLDLANQMNALMTDLNEELLQAARIQ